MNIERTDDRRGRVPGCTPRWPTSPGCRSSTCSPSSDASASEVGARARRAVEPARPPPQGPRARPGLVTRHRSEGDGRRTYLSLGRAPHGPGDARRGRRRHPRAGCSSSAPPTRRAPTSPLRCGAGPAPSRPPRPEPTPADAHRTRRRSRSAERHDLRCPTSRPASSPTTRSGRRPRHHRLRPGPRGGRRPGLGALVGPRPGAGRHEPPSTGRSARSTPVCRPSPRGSPWRPRATEASSPPDVRDPAVLGDPPRGVVEDGRQLVQRRTRGAGAGRRRPPRSSG